MANQRSSTRGRGAEILFGAPPAVEIKPRPPDPALEAETTEPESFHLAFLVDQSLDVAHGSPPPAEPGTPPSRAAPEMASYEATWPGRSRPAWQDKGLPAQAEDPLAVPDMERAFLEEALAAEEPPEPLVEEPAPTMEVTMEEQAVMDRMALFEPPPPETSNVTSGALPPRSSNMAYPQEETEATLADIQAPEEPVERLELPERELSEEERKKLLEILGDVRLQELEARIDETYEQVLEGVGESDQVATECYNQLLKARDILLRREVARVPQAEYYVEQVRARLKRAIQSKATARKYAWLIAIWGLLWFAAFIAALILLSFSWVRDLIIAPVSGELAVNMEVFVTAMVWGGIGGVAAIFYSLFKHVGRRDFDSQYNLSYVGKPFLGIILGATVYMIIHLMLLTLGILPAGLLGEPRLEAPVIMPWLIYLLAWVCGFKENRIFDLLDYVIKRIFRGEDTTPPDDGYG